MTTKKFKCSTCGEILNYDPSHNRPCSECGFDPKFRGKRNMTDGERSLVDYFDMTMGFRLKLAEEDRN